MKKFKCEHCKGNFESEWTDIDALKEYISSPYFVPGEQMAILCDDCHAKFKSWLDSLTEEDHKKIKALRSPSRSN